MDEEIFKATISYYMTLRHIRTKEQLRAHTTVGSNKTFLKYFKNPSLMPMGVAFQIMDALKIPTEDRIKLIRG